MKPYLVSVGYHQESELKSLTQLKQIVRFFPAPSWILCNDIVPLLITVLMNQHLQQGKS